MKEKDLKKYFIYQESKLMAYESMLYEINYTFEIIDTWLHRIHNRHYRSEILKLRGRLHYLSSQYRYYMSHNLDTYKIRELIHKTTSDIETVIIRQCDTLCS